MSKLPANFISEEKARKILAPHLPLLATCIKAAWQKWDQLKEETPELQFPLSARTRASYVHDQICHEIQHQFAGVKAVTFSESHGFLLMNIEDRLVIRFKKLHRLDQSSNVATYQQKRYTRQLPLPGIPELAARLTAGYQLDKLQSQILDIRITFPVGSNGEHILWSFSILGTVIEVIQPPLAFEEPAGAKVKAKGLPGESQETNTKEAGGQ